MATGTASAEVWTSLDEEAQWQRRINREKLKNRFFVGRIMDRGSKPIEPKELGSSPDG